MNFNLIDIILQDFKPSSEEHENIKLYLEMYKGDCEYYIFNSSKYKERITNLKALYHSIKVDLLGDICRKIYS